MKIRIASSDHTYTGTLSEIEQQLDAEDNQEPHESFAVRMALKYRNWRYGEQHKVSLFDRFMGWFCFNPSKRSKR